jgi:catalase
MMNFQKRTLRSDLAGLICAGALMGYQCAATAAGPADSSVPFPQAAVSALNRVAGGPHPGFRANHAKGVLLTGHFTATAGAAALSKAAHFKPNQTVPILVRFSNGTGVPNLPDADPHASPHGMAIRFTLPDQSTTDIVALSASYFPVAKPDDFLALQNAIADSATAKTKPTPLDTFFQNHPKAAAWAQVPRPVPESFATLAFYGVNAFKFTNAAGADQYIRYQILPKAGEHPLPAAQASGAGPDYLMDEIKQRVKRTPVSFRLIAQKAQAGDAIDDPSTPWPATRPTVELGVLTIDGVVADQVGEQKRIMFTPLALTDGIAASNDPILLVRPAAYAVSFAQRAN